MTRARGTLLAIALLLPALCGCAATGSPEDDDPLEGFNRGVYWVNTQLDTVIFEPLATGFDYIVPDPVQDGIDNFFDNILFPINFVNNLLQGEPEEAFSEMGRFIINSTAGIGGFIDVADEIGLEAHPADFGQTLGVWGLGPGPYLVLPVLGPSNFRDGVGLAADSFTQPLNYFFDIEILGSAAGVNFVNKRSLNLKLMEAFEESALDPYAAMRDAYFQKRQAAIEGEENGKSGDLYDVPKEEKP